MQKTKKMIKNLILFILLIFITFYILLKDQDTTQIFATVKSVNKEFLLIGIVAMFIYLVLEAVNLRRTLRVLGEKTKLANSLRYAYIGFFFSAITPAASGGQPMQVYYMHKDKISVAHSTLALLVNLCSFQLITIPCALISLTFNHINLSVGLIWFFIIGISLNSMALALLLIGIFSKKLSTALIKFAVKVLKFFRVKNIETKKEKMENELAKYHDSAIYIKHHKKMMLKTLLTTFVQVIIYYTIPYWVYRSFGFSKFNMLQIITLQSVLYATVSGIPLPGAVGVSEGGFLSIFKGVFTEKTINGAMLLNRGISFYLYVLISGIVVMVNIFRDKTDLKKEENKEIEDRNLKIDPQFLFLY